MESGSNGTSNSLHMMVAPKDEGATVYRASEHVFRQIAALEHEFAPRAGGQLLFASADGVELTPFAVRLFRKGYVTLNPDDENPRVRNITAVQPEFAARLHKLLEDHDDPTADEVVIPEAELPFVGPLAAIPTGMKGPHSHVFGVRPDEDPVEVLENILYGQTSKDDPEGSHHGEHEISDGIDRG